MSDRPGHLPSMLAIVPIRHGVLPLGAEETVAEAGGSAVLIGSDCPAAAERLAGIATELWTAEVGTFGAGRWTEILALLLPTLGPAAEGHLLLPASPDGRDLGPRLAAALDRDHVAAAIRIDQETAEVTRFGGRVSEVLALDGQVVASLQPGVRGITIPHDEQPRTPSVVDLDPGAVTGDRPDPELLEELPADPSTMDLAEAGRIVAGGAGLGSPQAFDLLRELAAELGASPGGTRVVTDWGWLPVERQIGTTGVTVDPELYLALGISGAVQHTAGLGSPSHIISVNTDPYCPMMVMSDLAIVCDGPSVLTELLIRLRAGGGPASTEDAQAPEAVPDQIP